MYQDRIIEVPSEEGEQEIEVIERGVGLNNFLRFQDVSTGNYISFRRREHGFGVSTYISPFSTDSEFNYYPFNKELIDILKEWLNRDETGLKEVIE
jgi:hypothetical protein